MKRLALFLCGAAALAASPAAALTITFDDLAPGDILSTQYAALGVTFVPSTTPIFPLATNTDLTIIEVTDVPAAPAPPFGLGTPSLVSGNIVRSPDAWIGEDGIANFDILFDTPVTDFSLDFASLDAVGGVLIFAFNGTTVLGGVASTVIGQQTLSFSDPSITRVMVYAGTFNDYVAFDNLTITFASTGPVIPEPAIWMQMIGGFALLGTAMRQRRRLTVSFARSAV